MGKTEVKHLPQRRDKKVPATLNTTIDQRVLTMLNAFVDWLNLEKADVCQLALENLMNEDAYKEFRDGFKTGAITAPAPPKVSGKSGKGKATAASA